MERVACRAFLSADQSNLVNTVWTKINLNSLTFDLGRNFNTDLYRFVAPVAGLYLVFGKADFENIVTNKGYAVAVYKNGTVYSHAHGHTGSATDELDLTIHDLIYLDKDDYVELYAQSNSGGDTVDVNSDTEHTFLNVMLLSKEGIKQ